jgi:clan AA aspartic protease (TIGR02281 family)
LITPPVQAALYSCTDSSGVTVITDSPAQLRECSFLEPSRPSVPDRMPPTPEPPLLQPIAPIDPQVQQTQPPAFSVPLERIGSLLIVTVQVNGTIAAKLILDTGASHTILSHAVARDLGLWTLHRSDSITMHTAGGTVQAEVLPIDSIKIGGTEVRHIEAAIHDLPEAPPNIEGLLGLNVLRHFTVTLDTVRNRLLLREQP